MTNDIKYVKIDRHAKSRGGFRVIQAIRKIEKRINEMNMKMWREILYPYEMAVDELILKFNNIQREYRNAGEYSPIEMVSGRAKKISSILEKCQRKDISLDELTTKVEDIAGIRIICQFVEDIYKVVEIIEHRTDMEIIQYKDYIHNEKSSGYRSYHVITKYEVQTKEGPKEVKVEIQIRTLAMNFWAVIEHSLQYKYKEHMPEHIRQRLSASSNAIVQLDNEMSQIRDEILDSQNLIRKKDRLVSEILNLIHNLYRVANKREVLTIQDEFYKVYQQGDISMLEKFLQDLDLIAESYRAQEIDGDI